MCRFVYLKPGVTEYKTEITLSSTKPAGEAGKRYLGEVWEKVKEEIEDRSEVVSVDVAADGKGFYIAAFTVSRDEVTKRRRWKSSGCFKIPIEKLSLDPKTDAKRMVEMVL